MESQVLCFDCWSTNKYFAAMPLSTHLKRKCVKLSSKAIVNNCFLSLRRRSLKIYNIIYFRSIWWRSRQTERENAAHRVCECANLLALFLQQVNTFNKSCDWMHLSLSAAEKSPRHDHRKQFSVYAPSGSLALLHRQGSAQTHIARALSI